MEWHPIETAPKDGTYILVTGERYDDLHLPPVAITRWIKKEYEDWEQVNNNTMKRVIKDDSHWDYCGISEEYWQPLPALPHRTGDSA